MPPVGFAVCPVEAVPPVPDCESVVPVPPPVGVVTVDAGTDGLERMMQQKPAGRQVSEERPAPAPDSPCYDCGYGKGWRCVGICYKKLMSERRKTA